MNRSSVCKVSAALLSTSMILSLLAGCGGNSAGTSPTASSGNAGGAASGSSAGADAAGTDTISFGVNYELTGANPIIGESAIKGIDMAVNEINAAGGITINGKSYKMAYKALDNGFNTDEAALNAQEFAEDTTIVAQIGPNDSDMCMGTQAIVGEQKLPTITPWSTLVELTECDYYFRACFTDTFQGAILATYAHDFEKATTAAILYDMSNPYNEGVASRFKSKFEELGGTVVEYLSYNGKTGETDFTSQMTKIASAAPDILLLPNFYEEIVTQTSQARSMGYKGKFMGSDTWGDAALLEWDTENLLDGALWCGHYHKDVASDAALKFIENYRKLYGTEIDPNDIVALNYDSVYLLKQGIENAQSIERTAIHGGLSEISEFVGVTGTMTYNNGNGDPTKSAVIIQIKDGQFKYLDTVAPN